MGIKKTILSICFLLLVGIASGQDIHLSQIDVNPILTNPAYCGFFENGGRFGLAYRNQWATVSSPYQTVVASAEGGFFRSRYHSNGFNGGLIFYSDKAGSLDYGTTQGNLVLSFFQSLGKNESFIALGLQAGFGQRSFSPENADMSDPTDFLENTKTNYFDFSFGAAWINQMNDNFSTNAGLSVYHVNRPNISYLGLDETFLEMKFNAYLRTEFTINNFLSLRPAVLLQFQQQYSEYLYGLDARLNFSGRSYLRNNLYLGCYFRQLDAFVFSAILEYGNILISANYDVNISDLIPASKSVGAFELGIVYSWRAKTRVKKVKSIPCPIF